MQSLRTFILGLLLLGGCALGHASIPSSVAVSADSSSHCVEIAVLSINDFHGNFIGNAYKGIPGAAALCATLDSLRERYPLHLTVSAGDNFGGSYFHKATKGSLLPYFFNEAGIRLSAIGNHEFDDGLETLPLKWKDSPLYPQGWDINYVCANLRRGDTGQQPEGIEPVHFCRLPIGNGREVTVAFVGLLTSAAPYQASARRVKGYSFDGRYEVVLDSLLATNVGEQVRKAPLRILLTHIGSGMRQGQPVWDDPDSLALSRIDSPLWHGILSSHTHQRVCGYINERRYPIVQGLCYGTHISALICTLDTSRMEVVKVTPQLISVTPKATYNARQRRLQALIDSLQQHTTIAGHPLNERLAFFDHTLRHSRAHDQEQTEVGSLVTEAYAAAYREATGAKETEVVIGCSHFGSIRTNLPKGDVTVLDVGEALPFSNALRCYSLTGEQLVRLADEGCHNVAFGRIQLSRTRPVLNEKEYVVALDYILPDGTQLRLQPQEKYILVADEYMTTGGDGYDKALFPAAQELEVSGMPTTTDAFIRYLKHLPSAPH